ncbi:hypothetical protein [Halorientalis halophila]|uniref:hypothetical protein n=1 Tax=Halorientalis halophila TaxID=3108499 RepID=UPI00300A0F81
MTALARLGVACVVLAVALAVTGSAGTTAVSADRAASIATGTDAEASLGLEPLDPPLANGREREVGLLRLHNRLPADLDTVRVTIADPDARPPRSGTDEWVRPLSVGETATVTAAVVCGGRGQFQEEWTLSIVATGPDTEIRATRTVTVACTGPAEAPS